MTHASRCERRRYLSTFLFPLVAAKQKGITTEDWIFIFISLKIEVDKKPSTDLNRMFVTILLKMLSWKFLKFFTRTDLTVSGSITMIAGDLTSKYPTKGALPLNSLQRTRQFHSEFRNIASLVNVIIIVGHVALLSDLARHVAKRKLRLRTWNALFLEELVAGHEPVVDQASNGKNTENPKPHLESATEQNGTSTRTERN
jgi:hypothetical protein